MPLMETEARLSADPASSLVTIRTELAQDRRIGYKENWETARNKINPLTPNDPYTGRTAPLTSKVAFYIFIQQI